MIAPHVQEIRDILADLPQVMEIDWPERLLPCGICKRLIQIEQPFFVIFLVNDEVTCQIHASCKES